MSSRAELTLPLVDARVARVVVGDALTKLVRDVRSLPVPSDAEAPDVRPILARISPLARSAPGLLMAALRRPSVYVHLRLAADRRDPALLAAGLVTLACELASSGAWDRALSVTRPPPTILVRSKRERWTPRVDRPLVLEHDGTLFQDGRRLVPEVASIRLSDAIDLALADDNPLALLEEHPDKSGSALDLGEASPDAWARSLKDALARVERHLPLLREELELLLSSVVPVGTDPERHLSASYREALGLVYVSLHPDPLTMTEAVIHEAQHNKLNAALATDPLLENDPGERYPSPVRPDRRPILGVLLAVHAFVPVAVLHVAMREAGDAAWRGAQAVERARQVLDGNAEGLALLERHARPTELGRALLAELRALHEETAARWV